MIHQLGWHIQSYFRTCFWRCVFAEFGHGSRVYGRITAQYPQAIRIGENVSIGTGVTFAGPIIVEDDVRISSGVTINALGLDYRHKRRPHIFETVIVQKGAWLCSGAIINPNVNVGPYAVIGAGAVVTKDVPAGAVYVGVPARPI